MKKIFIAPGHGGSDPGAIGKYVEKNINLEVGLKLKEKLMKHFDVMMSREVDSYVSISERVNYANNVRADLFISIHHNSSVSSAARGYEVIHSHYSVEGKRFAELVAEEFEKVQKNFRGARSELNEQGRDRFGVIRSTHMPAIITEFEFVQADNIDIDAQVNAIYNAVLKYYNIDNEQHWAEKHYNNLIARGIEIHEKRYDNNITRGEIFALLDRITRAD